MGGRKNATEIGIKNDMFVKKKYSQPKLLYYGSIKELTKNVTATSGEGQSGKGKVN